MRAPILTHRTTGARRPLFAVGLLAGLLIVELALRVVGAVAGPERLGGAEVVVHQRQLHDGPPPDVVVIGSSSSGAAFWPDEMHHAGVACRAYTAWLASATMEDVARYTQWLLDVGIRPRQVVVGVTMREFNANPSQASHDRLDDFLEREDGGLMGFLDDQLATIRMRRAVQDPVRFGLDLLAPGRSPATIDGHHAASMDRVIANESAQHREQEIDEMAAWALDGGQVQALEETIAMLRAQGVGVVVVNLPVTDLFVSFAPDGDDDYDDYLIAVEGVAERTGVGFLDGEEIELPEATLFADVNHLNQAGAEVFTAELATSGMLGRCAGPP